MMKISLSLLAVAIASANAAVPSLTPDNYDSMTDGKTVFIKFFAPWCGHCKKMAPDWEKLSAEWEGNEIGFVAEVDCTTAGKPLCDANGVKGFPTLKYGDPSALSDYQGGRTYDALAKFATENLKPICSPAKIELCDDEKKAKIEELMAMSDADISSAIEDGEKKIGEADETFKAEVQKLQEKYQSLMQEKDDAVAAVTDSGLGLLKSVQSYKAKAAKDEL